MFTLFLCLLTMSAAHSALADSTQRLPHYPAPIDTVMVEGRPIAYYETGSGEETLLFVHGLGSNLSFWKGNLPAFADEYRVLALDLPGYGLSGKADVPGTMSSFAATVVSFLDAVEAEQVHYVGASMGGQIGLTLALSHPERVKRLALVSPAGIETFSKEEGEALKEATTPEGIISADEAALQKNIAVNFADYDPAAHGWLLEQRKALARRDDFRDYAEANARSVAGMIDGPVYDRLGAVLAPTLVLYGAGDKLIPNRHLHPDMTTRDVAERARQALPNADVRMVEDAGHLLMLERPVFFNRTLHAFLDEGR